MLTFNKELYKATLRKKGLKNLHIAKHCSIERSRLSLCVNGWKEFNEEEKKSISHFLEIKFGELFPNHKSETT